MLKAILCVVGALIGSGLGLAQYQHSQYAVEGPSVAFLLGYTIGYAIIGVILGWVIASRMTSRKPD
jgi:hypothetical protein